MARTYLQIRWACNGPFAGDPVKKARAIPVQDQRTISPWMVSTFLLVLGLAVAAAMPAIAAAAARSAADSAGNSHGARAEGIVVRAKIQIVRAILPNAASGDDLIAAPEAGGSLTLTNDRIRPRQHDAGAQTAERGIKIRAPPGSNA
jgi:hypothetical protein